MLLRCVGGATDAPCADVVEFCSCIVQLLLLLLQCEVDLMGAHLRDSRVFTMGPLRSHKCNDDDDDSALGRPSVRFGITTLWNYLFIYS